jgi:hypothetical protein
MGRCPRSWARAFGGRGVIWAKRNVLCITRFYIRSLRFFIDLEIRYQEKLRIFSKVELMYFNQLN